MVAKELREGARETRTAGGSRSWSEGGSARERDVLSVPVTPTR